MSAKKGGGKRHVQRKTVLPDGKIRSLPFLELRRGRGRGGAIRKGWDQILRRSKAEP